MLAITTTFEHIGHWIRMRQSLARFSASVSSVHAPSWADFITTMVGFRVFRYTQVLRTILAPEPLPVRCDPIHLQQVIINLVMNGLDAMEEVPNPHNLTIRTGRAVDADSVEVRISDSGTGIPQDKLASIFDAFVTTKPLGTGLGLPIARTILESYGGEVWAENRTRGAVFTFRLPLTKA
jgi:signal transduction histidine kinase